VAKYREELRIPASSIRRVGVPVPATEANPAESEQVGGPHPADADPEEEP